MSYNQELAVTSAFYAVAEVSRVLREAIRNRQEFTVNVEAGEVEEAPIDGKHAAGHLDGGCEIRISVKPPCLPYRCDLPTEEYGARGRRVRNA